MTEKEVRFTEKKVDESWKEGAAREKGAVPPPSEEKAALTFSVFLTSLGYQALIHLGEIPNPETKAVQLDLGAAKETIDLLVLLETKTQGNRNPQEDQLLKTLLPELQLKFVTKVGGS